MTIAYAQGLHEPGDGLYAYLQPDGGWLEQRRPDRRRRHVALVEHAFGPFDFEGIALRAPSQT